MHLAYHRAAAMSSFDRPALRTQAGALLQAALREHRPPLPYRQEDNTVMPPPMVGLPCFLEGDFDLEDIAMDFLLRFHSIYSLDRLE